MIWKVAVTTKAPTGGAHLSKRNCFGRCAVEHRLAFRLHPAGLADPRRLGAEVLCRMLQRLLGAFFGLELSCPDEPVDLAARPRLHDHRAFIVCLSLMRPMKTCWRSVCARRFKNRASR